jgi:hypothetical protein
MPLFFFHTQTTVRFTDEEGTELKGPFEARQQAIGVCGEMLRDAPKEFWGSRPWTVTVTTAEGLVLWEIYVDGTSAAAAPE